MVIMTAHLMLQVGRSAATDGALQGLFFWPKHSEVPFFYHIHSVCWIFIIDVMGMFLKSISMVQEAYPEAFDLVWSTDHFLVR